MAVHGGNEILIKDALVFLFAAGVIVPVFRALKIPVVVGFVIAGVLLGPAGLGSLVDGVPILAYFSISEPEAAAPFAELGVLFLLFLLGLEFSFEKLWALRRVVFGAGALQVATSAAIIGFAAYAFGLPGPTAIIIGLALALSSTAIVMQQMIEERRAATEVGRSSLGVLLFQDLMVAPILIFVGFAASNGEGPLSAAIFEALLEGGLAILAIFLIGRFLLRRVFRLAAWSGGRDFLMALTLLTVVGAAAITANAGLSLALGAFLAGLMLGETEFKHQTEVDLEPFKGLLLGLFFMTVGMGLDLNIVTSQAGIVLAGLAALLVLKAGVAFVACRLFASKTPSALETAFLLAPAGEFAFVILAAAIAGGAIAPELAGLIAVVAGLSMVLIPLMGWGGRALSEMMKSPAAAPELGEFSELEGHVVIAGFGRVGQAIAHILRDEDAEIVALERDAMRVSHGHEEGWKVYLGDASRTEILERAGSRGAALFVVTVDDPPSAEQMVRAMRAARIEAPILARARDTDHADRLREAGATFVIPDAIEAGLQIAARALEEFGYDSETVRDLIAADRMSEYRRAAVSSET
ncbi:MAG: cation:proton antiporter [Pseudomonadota bacterium]